MSVIQVETRPKVKTSAIKRMRQQGIMPMALLERGEGTRLIQCNTDDLREVLSSKDGLKIFPLSLDNDRKMKVVVKQIDRHEVTRKVTNVVLQEVRDEDKIKIGIPVEVTGEPESVRLNKCSLMTPLPVLEVQGIVKSLPDKITVDASEMSENDAILVSSLEWPDDVVPLTSPDAVLATTVALRTVSLEVPSNEEGEEGAEAAEGGEGEAAGEEGGEASEE